MLPSSRYDNDDNEGNAEVRSLDRMRGQTELDRRSLSKSIFRLKYMRKVSTDYILLGYTTES